MDFNSVSQVSQIALLLSTAAAISLQQLSTSYFSIQNTRKSTKKISKRHFSIVIIINSKNEKIIDSVKSIISSGYKNYDLTIIDNNSKNKYIPELTRLISETKLLKTNHKLVRKRKTQNREVLVDSCMNSLKTKSILVFLSEPAVINRDFFYNSNRELSAAKNLEFIIPAVKSRKVRTLHEINHTYNSYIEANNHDLNNVVKFDVSSEPFFLFRLLLTRIKVPTYLQSQNIAISTFSPLINIKSTNKPVQKLTFELILKNTTKICFIAYPALAVILNRPNLILFGWLAYSANLIVYIATDNYTDFQTKFKYLRHVIIGYILFLTSWVTSIFKITLRNLKNT